uniref:Glycoprotein vOX2-4 n=1 Tax=Elephant endotheliotropic herpesvirus 1A TaxID=759753 RepID=A0A866VTC1_ELHV1|nr:glycoprotein vOX2-4 [Elephant endotheliotropic herpesvirus 1A]
MDLTKLVRPYVETKNHQLALLNTNVTLECALKNSYDSIFIITWHRNGTNGRTTVGTTGQQFHEERVPVTTITNDDVKKYSSLNILKTTENDSCCFICSFRCGNKSPNCSDFSNTTCLTIYASVETNISSSSNKHGGVNVTCLARALPPASNVTWIGASNIDNSTSVTNNSDGTLTVRSTLYVKDEEHQINRTVYCRVSHQVTVTYLVGPWNSTGDLDIFHLILQELNLSEGDLYFNDDDGGEDDDDYEDEDYEDDEKK